MPNPHIASRLSRRRLPLRLALAVLLSGAVAWTATSASGGRRFYDDDPLLREPETQDAAHAQPVDIGLLWELSYNLFVTANYKSENLRAQNINTIDELPESSWFTNRIGMRPVSPAALAVGAATGAPPAPGHWVIVNEKTGGANPGLTARDANGETWFLAFDRKENPEGPSAAVVIASRIFWALGYNQVEMFITSFDPKKATIDAEATRRRPSNEKTAFTRSDLDEILEPVARNADGTYRVAAGRLLAGKVLGPFRYAGTRPDDPNDVVPHEHRRELRALRVFGAWTNLTDLKAGNTLDTLVTDNGRSIVKHYLQDVGSTFGMANRPTEWNIGSEYFYESDASRRRLLSWGFRFSPWQTTPYKEYPSVGRFEGERFDPTTWKPQTPTTAYMAMRADDAFWAARRVMAFSDELIRAAVHTGQFSDAAAEQHLATVLQQRRDIIGRTYLTAVNPIVDPRLSAAGALTFENAAVAAGLAAAPARYRATWSRFDNVTGTSDRLGESESDPVFLKALRTTLTLATTAGIVSPLLFSIVAYILVRTRLPGRGVLDLMIWSAGAIPGILAGLGLLWVFIGTPLLNFLFGTIWALIIVVILQGKTTGVNIMKGVLVQVGADMEEAARVSGAGWIRTYFRIWLPLLMPTLILVAVMNFVSAAGATSSIILLASRDTMTLSLMALELSSVAISNREAASILSIFIIAITVTGAVLVRYFGQRVGVRHDMHAGAAALGSAPPRLTPSDHRV